MAFHRGTPHFNLVRPLGQRLSGRLYLRGGVGQAAVSSPFRPYELIPWPPRAPPPCLQVSVDPPDVGGREAILKVHSRNRPLTEDVDLRVVARRTPGFTGADLQNLLNEVSALHKGAGGGSWRCAGGSCRQVRAGAVCTGYHCSCACAIRAHAPPPPSIFLEPAEGRAGTGHGTH